MELEKLLQEAEDAALQEPCLTDEMPELPELASLPDGSEDDEELAFLLSEPAPEEDDAPAITLPDEPKEEDAPAITLPEELNEPDEAAENAPELPPEPEEPPVSGSAHSLLPDEAPVNPEKPPLSPQERAELRRKRLAQREARRRAHRRKQLIALGVLIVLFTLIMLGISALLRGCAARNAEKQTGQAEQTQENPGTPETPASEGDGFVGPLKPEPELHWTSVRMPESEQWSGPLALVNREHIWSFPDNADLVSLYERKNSAYSLTGADLLLDEQAMEPLNQFFSDFRDETGHSDLLVIIGFRSFEKQQEVYNKYVSENGEEYAEQYSAKPGTSEHHTGLAVDLQTCLNGVYDSLRNEGDYAWLFDHCDEYGFIQRFPADKVSVTGYEEEPWHFRYVGKIHATLMKAENLCLEEYIELLRQYPWDGTHLSFGDYELYFCSGDTVYVQEGWQYEASGINDDGYIVVSWQS